MTCGRVLLNKRQLLITADSLPSSLCGGFGRLEQLLCSIIVQWECTLSTYCIFYFEASQEYLNHEPSPKDLTRRVRLELPFKSKYFLSLLERASSSLPGLELGPLSHLNWPANFHVYVRVSELSFNRTQTIKKMNGETLLAPVCFGQRIKADEVQVNSRSGNWNVELLCCFSV